MRQVKKTLSIFMTALFVMATLLGNVTAKATATEVVYPTVTYVGVSHMPLVVGDTEVFTVTSKFEGKVQYRAFLYNGTAWKELTQGYGEAVDAKTPYVLPETPAFKLGQQKLSIWVKRADQKGIKSNSNGDFDNYYVAELNCISKDDANMVYTNGAAKVETDGLTVKVKGIENIGGIKGPYLYRLHIYNPITDTWTNRVTEYTETPSYTFEQPGTYMVVAHANTLNSKAWEKYQAEIDKSVVNQGKTYGTYEAWKTIMVEGKVKPIVKLFDTTVKAAEFGETVNVNLTTDGVKEFPTAKQYQIFDGVKAISVIADIGTDTTVLLAKAQGYKVNIKLLDASGKEIVITEVALAQSERIIDTTPVGPSTAEAKVIVESALFGSLVTVTSTLEGAVKYQVFHGVKAISAITEIGKTTTVSPSKVAGDKVNVKLIDAAGKVFATKEVVLVDAE